MKKMMVFVAAMALAAAFAAAVSAETAKKVARDGAKMQTENRAMPTRVIENGTKIVMHFGDTVIPGVLNDSETARALIAKLPYTVRMNSYAHDFCGVTEELPYKESEVHYGWLNGDIDYATDAPYFTILFEDQNESEIYGSQVNIGVITCPLADIAALSGSYDVLIELDESEDEPAMQMKINETPVAVAWEDNDSVTALKELAQNGLTIQMTMYGGFEQVGSIGKRLPSQDAQTSTSSGDIVLYSDSQLVVFYGHNSWAYTRLGHITDKTAEEMRELLSNGDVTITISVP